MGMPGPFVILLNSEAFRLLCSWFCVVTWRNTNHTGCSKECCPSPSLDQDIRCTLPWTWSFNPNILPMTRGQSSGTSGGAFASCVLTQDGSQFDPLASLYPYRGPAAESGIMKPNVCSLWGEMNMLALDKSSYKPKGKPFYLYVYISRLNKKRS